MSIHEAVLRARPFVEAAYGKHIHVEVDVFGGGSSSSEKRGKIIASLYLSILG